VEQRADEPARRPAGAEPRDLLTIVIEIDEKAEIRNSTQRSRSGGESMEVGQFFGLGGEKRPRELEGLSANLDVGSDSTSAATARSGATRS
jgi:flagellar L-ring protein precursor FlgH